MSFFHSNIPPRTEEPKQDKEKVIMEVDEEGVSWIKCAVPGIRISLQHFQLGQVVIDGANMIKLVSENSEQSSSQEIV